MKSRVLTPFCLTKQIGKTLNVANCGCMESNKNSNQKDSPRCQYLSVHAAKRRRALFFALKLSLKRAILCLCTLKKYLLDCDYKRL